MTDSIYGRVIRTDQGHIGILVADDADYPECGEQVTVIRGVAPKGLTPAGDGSCYGPLSAVPEDWSWTDHTEATAQVKAYNARGMQAGRIVMAWPPPEAQSDTELVPLDRALGRRLPNGDRIWCVVDKGAPYSDTNAPYYKAGDSIAAVHTHDALLKFPGMVEVLIEDDR